MIRPLLRSARGRVGRILRERRLRAHQPFAPIVPLEVASEQRDQSAGTSFDAERAFAWLVAQCEIGPRVPGTASHRATRDLIAAELSRHADTVAIQQWDQRILRGPGAGTVVPMCNIFGRFHGSSDRPGSSASANEAPPHLMLCAHWDTRPVADRDPDPTLRSEPVPGANDGASGVAVLLEMARVLAATPPPLPVLLAFWDGEDLGEYCYGSRLYARHCHHPEHASWLPRRAILLDMVGKEGLCCAREINSMEQAPALWGEVQQSASHLGLASHFDGRLLRINDDHLHTARAGIESILLIDYDYPEWHTTRDTPERCSPCSLQVVGTVLQYFIGTAAREAQPSAIVDQL